MADNSILAAYLASRQLAGGQKDPLAARERLAASLSAQGSSTEPVRSWGEGLARSLQGGLGGLIAGYTDKERKDTEAGNQTALADYIRTGDPSVLKGMKGELGNMVSAQLAGQKMALGQSAEGAAALGAAYGMPAPGAAAPQAGATGAPTPLAPLPGGSLPPGDFANNTGNIRASNIAWDGKGAPQNGFETFSTPQAGVNAQFKNFQAYAQANPSMTVAQALAKWAPPNENDTGGYISRISEESGVNPGLPLAEVLKDPMVASRLLDAQTRLEKGGMPQGVTADTFISAAGGGPAPGVPGQIAQGPQVAQGSGPPGDGSGTPLPPAAPAGPAAPAVPNVPRPQANPADVQRITNMVKTGKLSVADAQKEIEASIDRQWTVDRERANKEFDLKAGDYRSQRDQQAKAPQEATQNEAHAREQFNNLQTVKDYRKSQNVFKSAVEAAKTNSAAADLNLVYAFATMMDPGSVVREGEMGMVKATQNATDQVKAMVSAVTGGQRISPEARQALVDQMHVRYEALKSQHDELANAYGGIAERSGMKRDNVVVPVPDVPWTRNPASATGGLPAPPPGFRPIQ